MKIEYQMKGSYAIITNPAITNDTNRLYRKCEECGTEYNIPRGGEMEKARRYICFDCERKRRKREQA